MARDREVQRMLFDAGLAGICVPREYGGQGLTPAHQQALNEELDGLRVPDAVPGADLHARARRCCSTSAPRSRSSATSPPSSRARSCGCSSSPSRAAAPTSPARSPPPCATATSGSSTAPRCGPPAPGGPTGGSASPARTGTCRSTAASRCSCSRSARTGIEVHRIEMLNGNKEFCQEFLSDVRVPDTDRIGEVDDGWTVGTRWMFHERMLYNSPLVTFPVGTLRTAATESMLARRTGRRPRSTTPSPATWSARRACSKLVGDALRRRVGQGIATGAMSDQASAIARLFGGITAHPPRHDRASSWPATPAPRGSTTTGRRPSRGNDFLMRQVVLHRRRHHRDGRATSSASGCSACRASARSTATSRSVTSLGAPRRAEPDGAPCHPLPVR